MKRKLLAIITCMALLLSCAAIFAACDDDGSPEQTPLSIIAVTGKRVGDAPFQLSTTGGSGNGAVTYKLESGTAATVTAAGVVTITEAGEIEVSATKAADDKYQETKSAKLKITFLESLVIYKADFSEGNGSGDNKIFPLYGSVTDNTEDKTVTLHKEEEGTQGPSTYFGQNTAKNTAWAEEGMTVKITFKVDAENMAEGEGFTWNVAANNAEGSAYLTGTYLYFRKYEEGVKVGFIENGSSDEINATATSNEGAILLADGWYTAHFNFHAADGKLKAANSVTNETGAVVFAVPAYILQTNPGTGLVECEDNDIGGIRYAWVHWLTAETLEVKALSIEKNA